MATIVEGEGLDKTEIILVGFTGFCIIFQGFYSAVISGVPRQVFSSTIGMIPDLPNKARHISYQIYHSFTAWPLLAKPLQEIDVTDLVIQHKHKSS